MSTQLIVYPQTYDGTYDFTWTAAPNQWLVNAVNFINLSDGYGAFVLVWATTAANPSQDAINNLPPVIPGNWYRYYTDLGGGWGEVSRVGATQGGILIFSPAWAPDPPGWTGLYQKLSGLIPGLVYTVTINVDSGPWAINDGGELIIEVYDGSSLVSQFSFQTINTDLATLEIITTFTATAADNTILFGYSGDPAVSSNQFHVDSISIQAQALTGTGVYTELTDGQVICDLYEEEAIPLTLSIDEFKNVAEQVKSYSKDFNLPATKRNNLIFNNMFEVTRGDDGIIFNPYVKTRCVLKQDGFILFEGYLRMINIKDDEGEISYNVNLYSEVIAFADTLKELTFADLDFTELAHDYDYTEIRDSWNDSGAGITYLNNGTSGYRNTNSTMKYPNIDWNHQFSEDPTTGTPVLSNLESMFRPCIQLKYLINRIFANTIFSWTSNFFDSADFEKLYMDFNWGSEREIIEGNGTYEGTPTNHSDTTYKPLQLQSGYINFPIEFGYSLANFYFVAANNGTNYTFDYAFPIYMNSTDDVHVRWEHRDSAGTLLAAIDAGGWAAAAAGEYVDYVGNFTITLNQNDTVQPVFRTNVAATASQGWVSWNYTAYVNATVGCVVMTTEVLLETLRGELNQWDFLKGIMTMFNLVTLKDEENPNNLLIEPYSDVFINNTNTGNTSDLTLVGRGIQHDWTTKVDVSQMELKPLTDLNKDTNFKFVEDDDDYVFTQYKNSTSGHLYGSLNYSAETSSYFLPTLLVGEKEIIAEPFAATVSKPLMSQFPEFIVPSLYAVNDDGTAEAFENSPRIFYNNGIKTMASCTYNIPDQNGVSGNAVEDDFLQFSHLSTVPSISATTTDFVFASENITQLGLGSPPIDNLYSTYWQPYFNELYNADTRFMTLKVNLTPADINTFQFYDTVFIKNRSFRVNKIEYKPNELATVEFILIP